MKTTRILPILTFCLLFISCSEDDDINVDFSVEKDSFYLNEPVQFTNLSTGASTYLWNFGDGETSTEENPIHSFGDDGEFTVSLMCDSDMPGNILRKEIIVNSGTSSYQLLNNSSFNCGFNTFAYDGSDVFDLVEHGYMDPGEISDTIFTTNYTIWIGGYYLTSSFIFINPESMTEYNHTVIEINDNSPVYSGSVNTLKSSHKNITLKEYLK